MALAAGGGAASHTTRPKSCVGVLAVDPGIPLCRSDLIESTRTEAGHDLLYDRDCRGPQRPFAWPRQIGFRCYGNGMTAPDLAGRFRLDFIDDGLELDLSIALRDARNGQAKTLSHAD